MDTAMQAPHRTAWHPTRLDVTLVVLIAVAIIVPAWFSAREDAARGQPIEVVVTQDSQVLVDNHIVARAGLVAHLEQIRRQAPERHVVVRTDPHVKFSRVKSVLAEVEGVGFPQVTLRALNGPID